MFSSLFGKKKKKVLIIDDDVKALNTTKAMLSVNNDSFDVILALDRTDFLANIDKVDAVVSDYHMKDVTKIDFNQILNLCNLHKKPLLLLTGDIYPYHECQLSKPFTGKSLRANIEKMLEKGYEIPKKKQSRSTAA